MNKASLFSVATVLLLTACAANPPDRSAKPSSTALPSGALTTAAIEELSRNAIGLKPFLIQDCNAAANGACKIPLLITEKDGACTAEPNTVRVKKHNVTLFWELSGTWAFDAGDGIKFKVATTEFHHSQRIDPQKWMAVDANSKPYNSGLTPFYYTIHVTSGKTNCVIDPGIWNEPMDP